MTLNQESISIVSTTAATPLTEALPWRLFFAWCLYMEYTKPACSEEEHLQIMEERGLQTPDPDKAIHYLKYIGYYRLVSWMQGLVVLRNLCAHHGRLWNWKFPHTLSTWGEIPEDLSGNFAQNNTFYEYACLIMYFLKLISPKTTWAKKLSTLITEHKSLNISDMGFPEDWKDRIIWNNFL